MVTRIAALPHTSKCALEMCNKCWRVLAPAHGNRTGIVTGNNDRRYGKGDGGRRRGIEERRYAQMPFNIPASVKSHCCFFRQSLRYQHSDSGEDPSLSGVYTSFVCS